MAILKKIIFFIFLGLFFIFTPSPAYSLTLYPAIVDLQTEPGVQKSFSINVFNEGFKKYTIKVSTWDLVFDKNGRKISRPGGSFKNSITKYIGFTDRSFNLGMAETKKVDFNINIPKNVTGGSNAMIYFTAIPYEPPDQEMKNKVSMRVRLGVTLLQEVKGTTEIKSRITGVNIISNPKEPLKITMRVINEGNTHFYATGTSTIVTDDDNFVTSFPLVGDLVFPQKETSLVGKHKFGLASGDYKALITYKYRDKYITISKPFTIKN